MVVAFVFGLLENPQAPVAVDEGAFFGSAAGRRLPPAQVNNERVLKDQKTLAVHYGAVRNFLGPLTDYGADRAFQELRHYLHVPAALGERFNKLINPVRALVRLKDEVRRQHQERHEDRDIDVRSPIAVVEQGAPDAAQGGPLQRPPFAGARRRLAVRSWQTRGHRNGGGLGASLGSGIPRRRRRQVGAQ